MRVWDGTSPAGNRLRARPPELDREPVDEERKRHERLRHVVEVRLEPRLRLLLKVVHLFRVAL